MGPDSTDSPTPEPQSIQDAISANPGRFDEPAAASEPVETAETVAADPVPDSEPAETPAPEEAITEPAEDEVSAEGITEDPFAEYGGRETIEQAKKLYEATQTEDGIIQLFLETSKRLGLSLDQVETLFRSSEGRGVAEPEEDDDPERPVTAAELKALQEQLAQKEAQQAQQKAAEVAARTVENELRSLGIEPGSEDAKEILLRGDRYFEKGNYDPEHVKEALRRGHADHVAAIERARQGYIAKKEAAAAAVPSSPAGNAAAGGEAPPEPKDFEEAKRLARDHLRRIGALS